MVPAKDLRFSHPKMDSMCLTHERSVLKNNAFVYRDIDGQFGCFFEVDKFTFFYYTIT